MIRPGGAGFQSIVRPLDASHVGDHLSSAVDLRKVQDPRVLFRHDNFPHVSRGVSSRLPVQALR